MSDENKPKLTFQIATDTPPTEASDETPSSEVVAKSTLEEIIDGLDEAVKEPDIEEIFDVVAESSNVVTSSDTTLTEAAQETPEEPVAAESSDVVASSEVVVNSEETNGKRNTYCRRTQESARE